MQEDETTKIQQIDEEQFMLSSNDSYIIEQYRTICNKEGKTVIERCGIFGERNKVEAILNKIEPLPILWGQDPNNRFYKKGQKDVSD